MKTLYFLSGLPRSGSTLLGSILSQHSKLQATPTSPLADLLCWIDEGFSKLDILISAVEKGGNIYLETDKVGTAHNKSTFKLNK